MTITSDLKLDDNQPCQWRIGLINKKNHYLVNLYSNDELQHHTISKFNEEYNDPFGPMLVRTIDPTTFVLFIDTARTGLRPMLTTPTDEEYLRLHKGDELDAYSTGSFMLTQYDIDMATTLEHMRSEDTNVNWGKSILNRKRIGEMNGNAKYVMATTYLALLQV